MTDWGNAKRSFDAAEARAQGNHRMSETPASLQSSTGKLPDHFADVVKQVYGTNIKVSD